MWSLCSGEVGHFKSAWGGQFNLRFHLSKWYSVKTIGNLRFHKFNLIEESFTILSVISEKIDEMPKLIHAFYLPPEEKTKPEKGSHKEWEYLSIDFKNQNREQADYLLVKIRALGCKIVPLESLEKEIIVDKDAKLFKILAEVEHDRWFGHMTLSGWKKGDKRDANNTIHHDLIFYHKLSEEVKKYDRETVINIPVLLKKQKKKIVKRYEKEF